MRWSVEELDARWAAVEPSSLDRGRVAQVCLRPEVDQRAFPAAIELCPRRGVIGDRWERRTWLHLPDGSPDPRVQVAIANVRMIEFLQALTGCTHHPGDTLLVDFELHVSHLPTGAHLRIGSATLEISDVENDACAKFAAHYGADVFRWIRAPGSRERRLRGLFARVIAPGWVRAGDEVTLMP